ncbi:MAG: hypothetical protein CMK64_13140 [Pseudoalteromonas sp.]|nr:hypothetical protein [Pseudoalteromonas sp.]
MNKGMGSHLLAFNMRDLPSGVEKFLKDTFPHQQVEASYELTDGLSNKNYLVVIEQEKYVLKLYQGTFPKQSLLLQTRLSQGSDNVQKVVAWDQTTKSAIFNYVEALQQDLDKDAIVHLTHILAQIHQFAVNNTSTVLNLKQALNSLHQLFKLKFTREFDFAIGSLSKFPEDIGFCHNDLVKENCIVSDAGVVVIDFEYASRGDIYFDLAALVTSFELKEDQIMNMLQAYYIQKKQIMPSYASRKLTAFRVVYLLLCIAWYEERGEAEKAASHIEHLKAIEIV